MTKYNVIGKEWFDKVNGNSYCSARITDSNGELVAVVPFQYGYGNFYLQAAAEVLESAGVIQYDRYPNGMPKRRYSDIFATTFLSTNERKRDVEAWGKE